MNAERTNQVAAALAEVLPRDVWCVEAGIGMGHHGIHVSSSELPGCYWYFDNTFLGDDGVGETLRVYFTTENNECFDDLEPPDAPADDADAVLIAKWIVTVLKRGRRG